MPQQNDVMSSLSATTKPTEVQSPSVTKAVLPTRITILVKKIEWEERSSKVASEFIINTHNIKEKLNHGPEKKMHNSKSKTFIRT